MFGRLGELLTTLGRQIGMFIERRRAEAEALERQHFVESLTDANPSLIYLLDLSTRRTKSVNRRASALFGQDPDQIHGECPDTIIDKLIHPDDVVRLRLHDPRIASKTLMTAKWLSPSTAWGQVTAAGAGFVACEVVFRRDPAGQPLQILGTVEDITKRKSAEDRFRVLFESSSDGHLLFHEQDGVVDCNAAILRMMGCRDERIYSACIPHRSRRNFSPAANTRWRRPGSRTPPPSATAITATIGGAAA